MFNDTNMQISKPLTKAKEGMMLLTAFTIVFATMFWLPDVLNEDILGKFITAGSIWFGYFMGIFAYTYAVPDQKNLNMAFRIMAGICGPISVPLWIGIKVTNTLFREPSAE